METVTRENQEPDIIYATHDETTVFISPDGIGRFYYDSIGEAIDQHGAVNTEDIVWVETVED